MQSGEARAAPDRGERTFFPGLGPEPGSASSDLAAGAYGRPEAAVPQTRLDAPGRPVVLGPRRSPDSTVRSRIC